MLLQVLVNDFELLNTVQTISTNMKQYLKMYQLVSLKNYYDDFTFKKKTKLSYIFVYFSL